MNDEILKDKDTRYYGCGATDEMIKFRDMLDEEDIEWEDDSEIYPLGPIWRTHFGYRGYKWSVIHGFCTFGGFSPTTKDDGLLELMSTAVNNGVPVGFLTAEEAMKLVIGK